MQVRFLLGTPVHAGSEPFQQRQLRQVRDKRSVVKGARNEVLGIYNPAGDASSRRKRTVPATSVASGSGQAKRSEGGPKRSFGNLQSCWGRQFTQEANRSSNASFFYFIYDFVA